MFNVVWFTAAMDAVDEVFIAQDEPTQLRLVDVLNDLNQRLARSPLTEGESRSGPLRLTFVELFAIYFAVDETNAVVHVTAARRYGR